MKVPSLRYTPGQHRQQQHWQGWNQFGLTGVFLSAPRYDWCAPLSHPSSCMLVNHGPSQQSSKEEYKPLCYRKILHILYKDLATNEEVRAKIQQAIGPHEDLLTIVKRRKLQWYGHVSRSLGLAKTVLQGTVKGGRRQGGQRKRLEDNSCEWTGLEFAKSQRAVENTEKWRKLVAKSSVVPQRPHGSGIDDDDDDDDFFFFYFHSQLDYFPICSYNAHTTALYRLLLLYTCAFRIFHLVFTF